MIIWIFAMVFVVFLLAVFSLIFLPIAFSVHSLVTLATVPVQLVKLLASKRVRQNHAIEHATINVIQQKLGQLPLTGFASQNGFTIYGTSDSTVVRKTAQEALSRLRTGETQLAIHPNCGTSMGIVNLIAVVSLLSLLFYSGNLSVVYVLAAILAAIFLGPILGQPLQRFITTSTDLDRVEISGILSPPSRSTDRSSLPSEAVIVETEQR